MGLALTLLLMSPSWTDCRKEGGTYSVLGSVLLIFNTPDSSEQFYRGGNGAIGKVTNLFMVTQQDMVDFGLRTRFM